MLSASTYLIVFRVLHIVAAIAWGGAVFLTVFFLQPTAKAIGPAAGPFMRELLGTRKVLDWVIRIAWIAIIAGGFLYWHDVQRFDGLGNFLDSAFGLAMTIGALAALVAVFIGMFATKPATERSLALGGRIAQAGDPPPADLVQQLQATQARARTLSRWNLALIVVAAVAMSTARYW